MTALVVANAAIGAVGSYVLERAGESVVLTARRGLVPRLIRLRLSAVESAEPGDLMSRVTADTTLLRSVARRAGRHPIPGRYLSADELQRSSSELGGELGKFDAACFELKPHAVLVMHGLFGHAQPTGDISPRSTRRNTATRPR